jgi:hypothetical protein
MGSEAAGQNAHIRSHRSSRIERHCHGFKKHSGRKHSIYTDNTCFPAKKTGQKKNTERLNQCFKKKAAKTYAAPSGVLKIVIHWKLKLGRKCMRRKNRHQTRYIYSQLRSPNIKWDYHAFKKVQKLP